MKRLNNKGFAISTIIYGIAIMGILLIAILMAEMATIRANTRQLSKSIEDELNSYSKTDNYFAPVNNANPPASQEYIIPQGQSGWYKIELWGSQKGTNGGYGAYTSGIIELDEGDILYFYIGSAGSGRATDVRLVDGAYDDVNSYPTRIMVAAGGGSNPNADGGTLSGYTPQMKSYGGFINTSGTDKSYKLISKTDSNNDTNGTLVGFNKNYTNNGVGQPPFPQQSPNGTNGGGDGYNPGTSADQGGSSYIAGYAGVTAINVTLDSLKYYFVNGVMLPGVNQGAGKAKIERIAIKDDDHSELTRMNSKLNSVKEVKDCINTSNASVRIKVISGGEDITSQGTFSNDNKCSTLSFTKAWKVDEIAVFHTAGVDYENHTISVNTGSKWEYIKGSSDKTSISETETAAGIHISAYQYDSTTYLPEKGNYYILPVLSENKVITAASTAVEDQNPIGIKNLDGSAAQKWSIELLKDKKLNPNYKENDPSTYIYKVTELARYKALSIIKDENIIGNRLNTVKFNNYAPSDPQIWQLIPVGNGTYIIKTIAPSHDQTGDSGSILPQSNHKIQSYNELLIAKNEPTTARFKLIAIDNSSK